VTRQAAKILERAKREKQRASQEDQKGSALDKKADRVCKMAQHLQDTDDGEAQRGRLFPPCCDTHTHTHTHTNTHTYTVKSHTHSLSLSHTCLLPLTHSPKDGNSATEGRAAPFLLKQLLLPCRTIPGARLQKEAATSLEGRAAVLVGEAAKEEETFNQINRASPHPRPRLIPFVCASSSPFACAFPPISILDSSLSRALLHSRIHSFVTLAECPYLTELPLQRGASKCGTAVVRCSRPPPRCLPRPTTPT
jgi:hypothetical protein